MRPNGNIGFTRPAAARAILDRYDGGRDEPEIPGDVINLAAITAEDLSALSDLGVLDGSEMNDLERLLLLAARHPTMTASGYRVPPSRDDARITLTDCEIPWADLDKDGLMEIIEMHPEEIELDRTANVLQVTFDA